MKAKIFIALTSLYGCALASYSGDDYNMHTSIPDPQPPVYTSAALSTDAPGSTSVAYDVSTGGPATTMPPVYPDPPSPGSTVYPTPASSVSDVSTSSVVSSGSPQPTSYGYPDASSIAPVTTTGAYDVPSPTQTNPPPNMYGKKHRKGKKHWRWHKKHGGNAYGHMKNGTYPDGHAKNGTYHGGHKRNGTYPGGHRKDGKPYGFNKKKMIDFNCDTNGTSTYTPQPDNGQSGTTSENAAPEQYIISTALYAAVGFMTALTV